ncbi:uncharacterized protein LOC135389586 [Ornithodoros turicata]|uniref:uncharacterized protein LOC135389586 n=1 Tax=Ornithodoros turicata TaxID=34597 RepID=UPI003139EC3A
MPATSSGPDPYWSASVNLRSVPLDLFRANGFASIPVVLKPSNGAIIRSKKNPKALLQGLEAATPDFRDIAEVRQYGRGGIVCKSANLNVIRSLLATSSFGGVPVDAFIPHHLACVKGVVRGVDVFLPASEILGLFADVGALDAFRCSRLDNDLRIPTESVVVTFEGHSCPSEIKSWPLIFCVYPYKRRPLQCKRCFRFGHNIKNCRSDPRCRRCGEAHIESTCSGNSATLCCL